MYENYRMTGGSVADQLEPSRAEVARAARVPEAVSRASMAARELQEGIAALSKRLESAGVLQPQPPKAAKDVAATPSTGVGLADAVDSITYTNRHSAEILADVFNRLEI